MTFQLEVGVLSKKIPRTTKHAELRTLSANDRTAGARASARTPPLSDKMLRAPAASCTVGNSAITVSSNAGSTTGPVDTQPSRSTSTEIFYYREDEHDQYDERTQRLGDEHAHLVDHDEGPALGVKPVEPVERGREREEVGLCHLQGALMRVIIRVKVERVTRRVELDVAAKDRGDGARRDEGGDAAGAGAVCGGVVDQEAARHQEVAGEEQCGVAVVKRDMGL